MLNMEDIKGVLMLMDYSMKVINMTIAIMIISININMDLPAIIAMGMMTKAKSSLLKNKQKNVAMVMGIIKSMIITMLITTIMNMTITTIMNMTIMIMIMIIIMILSTSTYMDRTANTRKSSRFKTHSVR